MGESECKQHSRPVTVPKMCTILPAAYLTGSKNCKLGAPPSRTSCRVAGCTAMQAEVGAAGALHTPRIEERTCIAAKSICAARLPYCDS